MARARSRTNFAPAMLAIGFGASVLLAAPQAQAAEQGSLKIAVFDFELVDKSAGGGIIGPDAIDTQNLKLSTQEAQRMLAASGRYMIVEIGNTAETGGVQHCNGCESQLAMKLGADRSMVGVFTRVNRTEYTLQILVRDARTGAVLSNDFTGLRMGANYSWPRGVKWLMRNRILAAQQAK